MERRVREETLRPVDGPVPELLGESSAWREVCRALPRVAESDLPVLVLGETGSGKELVARAVHALSERRARAFVAHNCGATPDTLIESELFGHARGAFTGAVADRAGLFEAADQGTLFLDEIGDASALLQMKLLRALQEGEARRVGDTRVRRLDVRVVSATHRGLEDAVGTGAFRADLYYRLNAVRLRLPPLRERGHDVILLARHFIARAATACGVEPPAMAPSLASRLLAYPWPGNVRELENVIERAVVLSSGTKIGAGLIPENVRSAPAFQIPRFVVPPEGISFKDVITNVEKRLIESTLEATGGVQKRAAELLGIKATTLNEMMKRYEIGPPRKRHGAPAAVDKASSSSRSTGPSRRPFHVPELTRE